MLWAVPAPFSKSRIDICSQDGESPRKGSKRTFAPFVPVKAELGPMFAAFQQGHCYEPFVKYGNFSSSAPSYPVGTTVEFSCDPGYTLEQGSIIIECVDPHDPQWNETEPACRGQ